MHLKTLDTNIKLKFKEYIKKEGIKLRTYINKIIKKKKREKIFPF